MAIEYYLRKTGLKNLGENYVARIEYGDPVTLDNLDEFLKSHNSTIKGEQLRNGIRALEKLLQLALEEGKQAELGFLSFTPVITGHFPTQGDPLEPETHKIKINARVRLAFQKKMQKQRFKFRRVDKEKPTPRLDSINNHLSKDAPLLAACLTQLKGDNLNFNPDNQNEGLFYQTDSDDSLTRLDELYFRSIDNNRLLFTLPDEIEPAPNADSIPIRFFLKKSFGSAKPVASEPISASVFPLRPLPLRLRDLSTGSRNSTLTPGGFAELLGDQLDFNPEHESEGIFFLSKGSELRLPTTLIKRAGRLRIHFQIPEDLPSHIKKIQVRRVFNQQIRSGTLNIEKLP